MTAGPTASQRRVLPSSLLRDGETVLRSLRPHPLYIPLVSLPSCVLLLVVVLLVVIPGPMLPGGGIGDQHRHRERVHPGRAAFGQQQVLLVHR